MAESPTKVFVHIGTRKSGTSFVQSALRNSLDELAGQGVALTYRNRPGQVEQQLLPLERFAATGDPAHAERAMQRMLQRISRSSSPTQLMTLEDLAELPAPAVDLLLDTLETQAETHVMLTVRHWAATLPSEWQQDVKARDTTTYADFLRVVRDRAPGSERFLARQDLTDIVGRWCRAVPRERVHVVVVPPSSEGRTRLLDMFCSVIGVDASKLNEAGQAYNQSISLAQAEFLRRVNAELGDRLVDDAAGSYKQAVRLRLTRQTLMTGERASIGVPTEMVDWVLGECRRQRDALVDSGVNVVGDPEDLLPDRDEVKTGPAMPPVDEVLDVAVRSMATYATGRWAELSAHETDVELTRKAAESPPDRSSQGRAAPGARRAWWRR